MNTEIEENTENLTEGQPETEPQIEGETSSTPCVGPGACLCEAREQMGFSRAKVAQQLGLTEIAVKNLEKNHFDLLPKSVYVRGYLKNYAKILGENESDIIEIYDRFCKENNLASEKSTLKIVPEKKGLGALSKLFIGAAILAIGLVLIASFSDLI